MSSQHKLYNYEVIPPAEAWDRIAQELEDVNGLREVSQKLHDLQVTPPAIAWNKISEELDDQQSFDIIARKLTAVSVDPPEGIWHKIEANLEDAAPVSRRKEARVIPLGRRIRKYATAAAVLGVIAVSVILMVQRSSRDAQQMQARIDETKPAEVIASTTPAGEVKQNNIIKNNALAKADEDPLTPSTLAAITPAVDVVTTSNGNAYTTTVEKNHEVDGRYIVLMTEEGNVVRMSKKVSSMADCIAGEDHSSECNNKIEAWQKEVATMPVLASPDNILGLLELANKEPVVEL